MKLKSTFALRALSAVAVAGVLLIAPVIADELKGVIKSVNADANTLVVTPADGEDVTVTVNEKTVIENVKGKTFELSKLAKIQEKAKGKLKVEVTHEKGVASKILLKGGMRKKAAAKVATEKAPS